MILEGRQLPLSEGQAAGTVHACANSKVSCKQARCTKAPVQKGLGSGRPHSNQSSKEPATQKWHLFQFKALMLGSVLQNL